MADMRRLWRALIGLNLVIVAGTVGYVLLGFSVLDALYQTVTTVTTVGFREVQPLSTVGRLYTIVIIMVGVGTALYTLGILLESLIEGHLRQHLRRRRMDREIADLHGHVIICGWGRVGMACAEYLKSIGRDFVLVDRDPARLGDVEHLTVIGDVTDDSVLAEAGIGRARALVAALDTDADNVYVTLSARALCPDLVIIARARSEASKSKLVRAGATRAVNPQRIGGRRMAAYALQPHVAEFLDVVMHDENLEFRIEEITVAVGSELVGRTLAEAAFQEHTGVLLLAVSDGDGQYRPNPPPETVLAPTTILIALGTPKQLETLHRRVGNRAADRRQAP